MSAGSGCHTTDAGEILLGNNYVQFLTTHLEITIHYSPCKTSYLLKYRHEHLPEQLCVCVVCSNIYMQ